MAVLPGPKVAPAKVDNIDLFLTDSSSALKGLHNQVKDVASNAVQRHVA